jgi:hypothetical protein
MLMKTLIVPAFSVAVVALSAGPVSAQLRATPPMQLHAINPSLSLSSPAASPLQQQMQDDYATGLIGAQRDLLQQNPSDLGRQELAIGHELNGFSPR